MMPDTLTRFDTTQRSDCESAGHFAAVDGDLCDLRWQPDFCAMRDDELELLWTVTFVAYGRSRCPAEDARLQAIMAGVEAEETRRKAGVR